MAKVTLDIEIDAQGNVTAIGKAEDALDDLEKGGKRAAAQLEKVRRAQDKLANGAIIAGGAIVAGSYVAVQAASNLNEAQNRVTVAFGEQADAIKKWASDSANRIGMSKREALEGAAAFGELMQATGSTAAEASKMSREMVDLAADIASIKNLRPEDALLKLQAGLTGEAEPLKRIGILVDDATVKTKAYEMGLAAAGSELSQQQKVQARYAVIMEQTSSMQGDFARTSDEVANSRRRMNATIEDSIAKIGSGLQPAFKALLGAALPVAETIGEIAETKLGQWAIVAGAGLGALALAAGVTYKGIVAVQGIVQAVNIVLGGSGRSRWSYGRRRRRWRCCDRGYGNGVGRRAVANSKGSEGAGNSRDHRSGAEDQHQVQQPDRRRDRHRSDAWSYAWNPEEIGR